MFKNPMIKDYAAARTTTHDDVGETPNAGPAEVYSTPPGDLTEAQHTPPAGSAPSDAASDDDPDTQSALKSDILPETALDRASAPIHKSFQGDCSLLAGPGRGIQSVTEYRRK